MRRQNAHVRVIIVSFLGYILLCLDFYALCFRIAGGMGALSWVTVSINAHNFVTDVISGKVVQPCLIFALTITA